MGRTLLSHFWSDCSMEASRSAAALFQRCARLWRFTIALDTQFLAGPPGCVQARYIMRGSKNIYLNQSPAVSMGLEPFRSTADAVRRWVYGEANCDQMTNSVPNQEQFVTIVPDTRARFASGRWRAGRLELSIDAGVDPSELELQIIRLGSSERSSRHCVARGAMDLKCPKTPRGWGCTWSTSLVI